MSLQYFSTFEPYNSSEDDNDGTEDSESSNENIIMNDDDTYTNTEDLDVEDQIFYADEEFMDAPRVHGGYYLGNAANFSGKEYTLDIVISPTTFFRFRYHDILNYLNQYSIFDRRQVSPVDILKLYIIENHYTVIIKTYWLRLIQRHWKQVFRQRKRVIQQRKSLTNLRYRELNGRHLMGVNYIPGLYGMLSIYA